MIRLTTANPEHSNSVMLKVRHEHMRMQVPLELMSLRTTATVRKTVPAGRRGQSPNAIAPIPESRLPKQMDLSTPKSSTILLANGFKTNCPNSYAARIAPNSSESNPLLNATSGRKGAGMELTALAAYQERHIPIRLSFFDFERDNSPVVSSAMIVRLNFWHLGAT
jgi:hypothetical protein